MYSKKEMNANLKETFAPELFKPRVQYIINLPNIGSRQWLKEVNKQALELMDTVNDKTVYHKQAIKYSAMDLRNMLLRIVGVVPCR